MSKFAYKATRFKSFGNVDAVFDSAEPYIANVKRDYMYMCSDANCHYFKHKDTKEYQHAPYAPKS
jgi:hypothetical protein